MHVVIPMAGKSSRFTKYGFKILKHELPVDIKMTKMIEKAINSLNIDGKCTIVTQELVGETEGPACTVNTVCNLIDDEDELIITNCDQIMEYNSDDFLNKCRNYDGCVMTYTPDNKLIIGNVDKHSFIAFNPIRFSEKIVISENALTGIHYFKKSKYFKDAYKHMISINRRAPNGEFYVSLVYQSMVDLGYNIGMYKLTSGFYPVGEPIDYFNYLYAKGGYENIKFRIYNGYKFENTPIVYKNDKLYINDIIIEYKNIDVSKYTRGWIIGNFEPCLYKSNDYEVGLLFHKMNEQHDFHYHLLCDEINFLYSGKMKVNEIQYEEGDVFVIPKNQVACPKFITDCKLVCVKTASNTKDKLKI